MQNVSRENFDHKMKKLHKILNKNHHTDTYVSNLAGPFSE